MLSWQVFDGMGRMISMQVPTDLKRRYLARRIEEIQKLRAALYVGDYSQALRLGHQIKGNAATFEFDEMGPLGKEIEKAASEKDRAQVEHFLHKVESFIYQAETLLG